MKVFIFADTYPEKTNNKEIKVPVKFSNNHWETKSSLQYNTEKLNNEYYITKKKINKNVNFSDIQSNDCY